MKYIRSQRETLVHGHRQAARGAAGLQGAEGRRRNSNAGSQPPISMADAQSKAIKDLPDLFPSESTANLFAVYVRNI
jgi:hypothetical protein